jgi:hypothetical protein
MPPRPLRIAAVRDLGPQFTRNDHRMAGQDGAYSIPLPDGTAFWFFGDTAIGERPPGSFRDVFERLAAEGHPEGHAPFERMPTNTGLLLRDRTGEHGLRDFTYLLDEAGEIRQLIPLGEGEREGWDRAWCLHGIAQGERLYLYYQHIRMLEERGGPFAMGFDVLGTGLARGEIGAWRFERIPTDGEDLWWPYPQPQFANCVLPADGWLYLYGVTPEPDGVQRAYLARVRPDDIERRDRYAYYDGAGWSPDVSAAAPLFDGPPNELSVSYNAYLGSYLCVHSMYLAGPQVVRTAPQPWGPWSAPTTFWTVEAGPGKKYPVIAYAAKEHPELARDGGRVLYVTFIEHEEYFPHLLEVTLG